MVRTLLVKMANVNGNDPYHAAKRIIGTKPQDWRWKPEPDRALCIYKNEKFGDLRIIPMVQTQSISIFPS